MSYSIHQLVHFIYSICIPTYTYIHPNVVRTDQKRPSSMSSGVLNLSMSSPSACLGASMRTRAAPRTTAPGTSRRLAAPGPAHSRGCSVHTCERDTIAPGWDSDARAELPTRMVPSAGAVSEVRASGARARRCPRDPHKDSEKPRRARRRVMGKSPMGGSADPMKGSANPVGGSNSEETTVASCRCALGVQGSHATGPGVIRLVATKRPDFARKWCFRPGSLRRTPGRPIAVSVAPPNGLAVCGPSGGARSAEPRGTDAGRVLERWEAASTPNTNDTITEKCK